MSDPERIRESVRARYGGAALRVLQGESAACCGPTSVRDPITSDLYDEDQRSAVPEDALRASLGCGNPTVLAALAEGETVLDLGSGGGIDVLLSARRVGPAGRVYGLDTNPEMLRLARANAERAGASNVTFLEGDIERIPLPDGTVDVILSNCVINLSTDKAATLREAFRVLRPGGRFAVSDLVVRGELPEDVRASLSLWSCCVAGALTEEAFRAQLAEAGFGEIDIEVTRAYDVGAARGILEGVADAEALAPQVAEHLVSAFVRARKP